MLIYLFASGLSINALRWRYLGYKRFAPVNRRSRGLAGEEPEKSEEGPVFSRQFSVEPYRWQSELITEYCELTAG
jgi:hypothetical protein